jgi:ParB-like nuclease domain
MGNPEPAVADGFRARAKVDLVPLSSLRVCPENENVYGAQSVDDPDIVGLIESIRDNGLLEPIHISADNVVISGHRRRFCAFQAGLRMVPVIRSSISYRNDRDAFLKRLVEANEQRKKSAAILMREAAMKVDPQAAVERLIEEQQEKKEERRYGSRMSDHLMEASDIAGRKKISKAKLPFLAAALKVVNSYQAFWPLSVRQVHYRLLGDGAPLKHASKPDSKYENDENSYKALVDLVTRARIEGSFPWEAIDDETRPEDLNNHFWNVADFTADQLQQFMSGYQRNRQQSQTAHIEIVAEKLTVKTILSDIAADHSIPLSISRGHNGPTMKRKIAQRFRRGKKAVLILLVVTDLDPAGEAIVQNFRDDFEDDHGISAERIEVYRAGLNMDRVRDLKLTPSYDTGEKEVSTTAAYAAKYGTTDAYELEAMEPDDLRDSLIEDIDGVLDIDAYNAELEREKSEAVAVVLGVMQGLSAKP